VPWPESRDHSEGWIQRAAGGICPACGSRVWHEAVGATDTISVKDGLLDEPPDLRSACHIWTPRALPGVVIPEAARQFPGEPD
jgi:hypothetical protein